MTEILLYWIDGGATRCLRKGGKAKALGYVRVLLCEGVISAAGVFIKTNGGV